MNEKMVMEMLKPYIENNSILDKTIHNVFDDILSKNEIDEIIALLVEKDINVINTLNDNNYYQLAQPYVKSGYMTYDDFDKVFCEYSRKKQYEIVETLFSLGVELFDGNSPAIDIVSSTIEDLTDPTNITEEERDSSNFEILYDENIFKDKSSKVISIYSNVNQKNETLCKLIQQGNTQARQDICIKNERLVQKYAVAYLGYYGNSLTMDDLVQSGFMGLLKAAENFDVSSDYAFSTYATLWIKQSITRDIADFGFMIRIPVHMMERIIKITKLENKYDISGVDDKTIIKQIAEDLEISEDEVRSAITYKKRYLNITSLNTPTSEKDDTEIVDFIADDESESIEEMVESMILSDDLNKAMSTLSDKEQKILKYRFGMVDNRAWTLEEAAGLFGVTRERIRQIECKALRRLRHPSRSYILKKWI